MNGKFYVFKFSVVSPFIGLYGNNFAYVYSGYTVSEDISINRLLSFPISSIFLANPQSGDFIAF